MGHGQGGHTHRNQTARTSDRHPLLRKYSTAPVHFIECVIILFFYFFLLFLVIFPTCWKVKFIY